MHPELKAGVWVTPVEVEPDYVKSSINPHFRNQVTCRTQDKASS